MSWLDDTGEGELPQPTPWFVKMIRLLVALFLFAILAVMVTDVVGRYFFNTTIKGGFEIIALLLGLLIFSAVSLNTYSSDHLVVGLLDQLFHGRIRFWRDLAVQVISVAALGFIAQRMWALGTLMYASGQPGKYFDIKMWPFAYAFALLSACACVVALLVLCRMVRDRDLPHRKDRA